MEPIQQKVQSLTKHVDEAVGYGVALGTGSTPVWVESLTGWLELLAIVIAIAVGLSTWQLNRVKIKKIKESEK